MQDIESHPGRPLLEHLQEVKNFGLYFYESSYSHIFQKIPCDILKNYLTFHDIGKATPYFQAHLNGEKVEDKLKNHALISAILFLWYSIELAEEPLKVKGKDTRIKGQNIDKTEEGGRNFDFILAFMIIIRHHSNLSSVSQVLNLVFEGPVKSVLNTQWNSINKQELHFILAKCGLDENIVLSMVNTDMDCILQKVEDYLIGMKRKWKYSYEKAIMRGNYKNTDLTYYFKLQQLFSLLTDSDKSDVVIRDKNIVSRMNIDIKVNKFMQNKGIGKNPTPLNIMRQSAFEEVEQSINIINIRENKILHLTLPTGFGKTLTSFNFAFKFRNKLKYETSKDYRIIYVLPFTSVIDQNAKIMEDILLYSGISGSSYLIKHHHLEPIDWTDKVNNQEYNYNMASILFEGWNSEIIVTSFVQFFETLIGWTNRRQRKFHKLNNCIVLIDEIQAIPAKYYELIRKVLIDYSVFCNSYVVAMTATQPKIFEDNEIKGLCDSKKYFSQINRITFKNNLKNTQSIEEFASSLTLYDNKRYLIILNTISSAKRLYNILNDLFPERNSCFLSAHIVPKDRLDKIYKIKQGHYDLVVSTQVVEAGVDIDFDVVYRDFAPLPSLIQSAGRSNREWQGSGRTIIIKLVDGSGKSFAKHTYKGYDVDLKLTEELLNQRTEFTENELHSIIEQYFYTLRHGGLKSMDESYALLKGMSLCIFDTCEYNDILPVSSFRLIDDDMYKFPVFVELDEHAISLWEEYSYVLDYDIDKWDKKNKLSELNKKMSEYVINVGNNHLKDVNIPPAINGYLYVSNNQIGNYYNKDTGFGEKGILCY